MNKVNFPIVWDDKYSKLGVSPRELYLRQTGGCWLIVEGDNLYCTDGNQKALTAALLNPTFECCKCMSSFAMKAVNGEIKKNG